MARRLLFIVNEAGYFRSHRLPLALAAREAGWEVAVATAPGPGQAALREAGLEVHDLPITRRGLRPDRELATVWACVRLLRRLRPDLVHCVALKAVVIGGLAARISALTGGPRPALVQAIAGLGHVLTARGLCGRLLRGGFLALLRLATPGRGRIIVQNRADGAFLEGLRSLARRRVLIPGAGVDLEAFRPAPEPEGPVTVLMASRLIWKKGVGEYVEAARRLRERGIEARFLLAGESDPGNPAAVPRERLEAWHREGVVEWLGRREDMAALLAASHIACLPSYYGEGVPKSLIEAAAAGRPIVTTDQPGCASIGRPELNALQAPQRDVAALAKALERLVADPALRRRLGAQGRILAETEFGEAAVIGRTLAVYEALSAEASAAG